MKRVVITMLRIYFLYQKMKVSFCEQSNNHKCNQKYKKILISMMYNNKYQWIIHTI